jgi:hypothetical protein
MKCQESAQAIHGSFAEKKVQRFVPPFIRKLSLQNLIGLGSDNVIHLFSRICRSTEEFDEKILLNSSPVACRRLIAIW